MIVCYLLETIGTIGLRAGRSVRLIYVLRRVRERLLLLAPDFGNVTAAYNASRCVDASTLTVKTV